MLTNGELFLEDWIAVREQRPESRNVDFSFHRRAVKSGVDSALRLHSDRSQRLDEQIEIPVVRHHRTVAWHDARCAERLDRVQGSDPFGEMIGWRVRDRIDEDVAGHHDLLLRQEDDRVAAGVAVRNSQEIDLARTIVDSQPVGERFRRQQVPARGRGRGTRNPSYESRPLT